MLNSEGLFMKFEAIMFSTKICELSFSINLKKNPKNNPTSFLQIRIVKMNVCETCILLHLDNVSVYLISVEFWNLQCNIFL